MENNDMLIRIRYALDIKNRDMVEIFKLGGLEVTPTELVKILTKLEDSKVVLEEDYEDDNHINCTNNMMDAFLNGFIIHKRGKREQGPGQPDTPVLTIKKNGNLNNLLLKRLKIALELTSEEMLDIFESAGISITNGELSAVLRKEGHRNYKECGDKYIRNFLKGLAVKYRD